MYRALRAAGLVLLSLGPAGALAAPVEKPLVYSVGDKEFRSVLVYDDASESSRPGLVLVPNWYGANDAAVAKARAIAGDDYVILVADVFGKEVRPKDDAEALASVKAAYAEPSALRTRAAAALSQLRAQAGSAPVDAARLGAIGFCFGGSVALELARSGADLAGVASFHGGLKTAAPAQEGEVEASVLVLNGADDRNVSAEEIAGLQKEMTDAKVDWQFVNLSGAVHCFAEPDQNSPPGCVYNERAATRAFNMMNDFFAERFAAN